MISGKDAGVRIPKYPSHPMHREPTPLGEGTVFSGQGG